MQVTLALQGQDALACYAGGVSHDANIKTVLRAYKKALDSLQRLDRINTENLKNFTVAWTSSTGVNRGHEAAS